MIHLNGSSSRQLCVRVTTDRQLTEFLINRNFSLLSSSLFRQCCHSFNIRVHQSVTTMPSRVVQEREWMSKSKHTINKHTTNKVRSSLYLSCEVSLPRNADFSFSSMKNLFRVLINFDWSVSCKWDGEARARGETWYENWSNSHVNLAPFNGAIARKLETSSQFTAPSFVCRVLSPPPNEHNSTETLHSTRALSPSISLLHLLGFVVCQQEHEKTRKFEHVVENTRERQNGT